MTRALAPGGALYETERLTLRLARPQDVPEIVRFYVANGDHLRPWSPTFPQGFFTEAFWLDQVAQRRADLETRRAFGGFLFTRQEPTRVIGQLALSQVHRSPLHACILGYSLAADAQGRGYMTEAVRGAVAFAFGPLNLHRVSAGYMPHNRRSGAVLRRAGFTVEGYARDYLLIDGRWEDHLLTAIVNPDWRP